MSNELASTTSAPIPPPAPLTVLPGPPPAQTRASKPKVRNGRIARLPKLERDMVNRMLSDAIPHNKIAEALAQRGFKVTPRNVSNWATRGGYHQWRADQALLVQTRLDQDTLTDLLHDDPTRLPEVGLQIMATRFSQTILHSDLDPRQSLPLVAMLCRINHEILKLHKFRDLRCTIGHPGYQFERVKRDSTKEIEILRKTYSGQPVDPEQSSPKYTILDLIRARRKGKQAAIDLWSQLEPEPPHRSAPARSAAATAQPAQPARVPPPPRKPKTKIHTPTPAPAPSPAADQTNIASPRPSEGRGDGGEGSNHPAADAPVSTAPPIENQNSKIANPPLETHHAARSTDGEGNFVTPLPPAPITPSKPTDTVVRSLAPSEGERAGGEGLDNSKIKSEVSSPIENQNSKLKNPPFRFVDNVPEPPPAPQQCPRCLTPLKYFADGSPPLQNCPKCKAELPNLYGHEFERCPACKLPLPPLLPNGLRPSGTCAVCGCGLPTPSTPGPHPSPLHINPRVCVYCRTPIPWDAGGVSRPSAYCAKCHATLPRIVYKNPRSERVG